MSTGRITNEARIKAAWHDSKQKWPPEIGDKIKLFVPKDLRGKTAKVIAVGDEKTKTSTRRAPKGKVRVQVSGEQFAVSKNQVFPKEYSLKQLCDII